MSVLVRMANSSPVRWDADPAPVEANETVSGAFLASATKSAKFLMPDSLLTTNMLGKFTPPEMGAKSLKGS